MSEGEFENYLMLIGRLLRLSPAQREAIGEELRDHFESRLAELLERGLAHDEAVRIALEEFGDAAGLAASFTSISQTRRRRLIMRCTVASVAALAAAVVVAMAVWPENHAGKIVQRAVADTKASEKAVTLAESLADKLSGQTNERLKTYTEADFTETPLSEVLAYLADKFDVQVYLEPVPLRDAGIDPTSFPVTLHLKHVKVQMLLDLILRQHNLGYTIRDGIVFISTNDWLNRQVETRVYDCRGILSGDGAKTPVTVSQPLSGNLSVEAPPRSDLTKVIEDTIQPSSWRLSGGDGAIAEFNGLLVVTQTADVHAKVADLLEQISAKLSAKPVNK
jgi:hypothetical protein